MYIEIHMCRHIFVLNHIHERQMRGRREEEEMRRRRVY